MYIIVYINSKITLGIWIQIEKFNEFLNKSFQKINGSLKILLLVINILNVINS